MGDPTAIAFDSKGNVFFADRLNHRVRKIDAQSGVISTAAGSGDVWSQPFGSYQGAFAGDGGSATSAKLATPSGLAIDANDNLYIADTGNLRIRKVAAATGIITTIAGNGVSTGNVCGQPSLAACFSGDGGPATSAQLYLPLSVAVDHANNVYFVDGWKIRKIDAKSGTISTVVGSDNYGYSGDGGPATAATLYKPQTVAIDNAGDILIPDFYAAAVVRRVDAVTGVITTIAGGGPGGYPNDGDLATSTQLGGPSGVAVDPAGPTIYVFENPRVFALTTVSLSITNAGSNLSGPVAPGEIIVLSGSGLGPAQLTSYHIGSSGLVDCQLAGTSVQINGVCAPIVYTSSTQVAAIVPYSVSGSQAQITVVYQGQTAAALSVPVSAASPGVFTLDSTGKGPAACVNQDGSINTTSTPAKLGDIIACFATGEGQTSPGGVDGKPATVPFPKPILPVTVMIGNQSVIPVYAGGAPGEVAGVMQVNFQIPSAIQTGSAVPIAFRVGNTSSQSGVSISVR